MTVPGDERALFLLPEGPAYRAAVRPLDPDLLPDGDLEVRCLHSSLNFKDALAVLGEARIVRGRLPFVPGIDVVAEVIASRDPGHVPGDVVIQTGWGLGETRWGGYSTRQRLDSAHVVGLPDGMTPEESMIAGTAGLTAALAVLALEEHGVSREAEVVVTGATGGVGSFAVRMLTSAGFRVAAVTGKTEATEYLLGLGAERVLGREEFSADPSRPLLEGRWAGAVDSVGGEMLSALLSGTMRHGTVAACGLAGGSDLRTTVFPFILRGVNLLGIDSNTCPSARRVAAWERLKAIVTNPVARPRYRTTGLSGIPVAAREQLDGIVTGRVVVDCGQ